MALGATVYRLSVALSDVDRGVYEALDLRVARHPSESMRYLVTRALAYCLFYEEGIGFSRGLSSEDEPAVWIRDLQGTLRAWIDIGAPSPDRLHKASKATDRVAVVTSHEPAFLLREARGKVIHRGDAITVVTLPAEFLDALGQLGERHLEWEVVHNDGHVYVTSEGHSLEAPVVRRPLVARGEST